MKIEPSWLNSKDSTLDELFLELVFYVHNKFGECLLELIKVFKQQNPYLYQNTMANKTLISVLVVVLLAVGMYFYAYKDHRNIANEGAAFADTAQAIKDSLAQNNEAFFNQTLEVSGVVTAVEDNTLTLNDALVAQFESSPTVTINQQLTLKGRCIGYDDLFEVVVIDQSIILE